MIRNLLAVAFCVLILRDRYGFTHLEFSDLGRAMAVGTEASIDQYGNLSDGLIPWVMREGRLSLSIDDGDPRPAYTIEFVR